jgi:hypothetical protein
VLKDGSILYDKEKNKIVDLIGDWRESVYSQIIRK